jgi:hypothetical protein
MPDLDRAWKSLAENSREALALLGYPITPRCLPGETEPCGGSYADHAAAHLITLLAVAEHHLTHVDQEWLARIRAGITENCRQC